MHEKKLVFRMVWSGQIVRCVVDTALLFRCSGSEFFRSFSCSFLVLFRWYRASGFRLGVFRDLGGNQGNIPEPGNGQPPAFAWVLSLV